MISFLRILWGGGRNFTYHSINMKELQHRASLRADGWYANVSEAQLAQILKSKNRNFVRRGYPDFTVLDTKGDIWGFIEVKKTKRTRLREDQERFARFCAKHNIPFFKWTPEHSDIHLLRFLESGSHWG
jgi:hypothetical protein